MSIGRVLKRKTKAAIPPLVFLALAAYFGWSATQGDHGLQAYAAHQQDLIAAQAEFQRVQGEQEVWERRVAGLRTNRLDPDMLDERARAMLNLADPADIVLPYGPNRRLY